MKKTISTTTRSRAALTFKQETVRRLTDEQLQDAGGGLMATYTSVCSTEKGLCNTGFAC